MSGVRRTVWIAACLITAAATARAHHSFSAEFDANRPVDLRGTVTEVEWVNPHAWIHVDVKWTDGKIVNWRVEGATPNTLIRRGFTKQSLLPGTSIRVTGYRAKDGSPTVNGRDVTLADGRKVFLGSSGTGAPYEEAK